MRTFLEKSAFETMEPATKEVGGGIYRLSSSNGNSHLIYSFEGVTSMNFLTDGNYDITSLSPSDGTEQQTTDVAVKAGNVATTPKWLD